MKHARPLESGLAALLYCAACAATRRPLAELPIAHDRTGVVLVLHARDCPGNLASLSVFERGQVRRALPLIGVVALDDSIDADLIGRALAAYDIPAPLLRVSAAARDSLRAATHNAGMTLVLVRNAAALLTLRAPRDVRGAMQRERDVLALVAGLRLD